MPYIIKKKSSRWCVYKETEQGSGEAMGDPLGCHDTEEAAKQQLAAVYASEDRESEDHEREEKSASGASQSVSTASEVIIYPGGEIKALDGSQGLVGGYLVRFGGEDLDGECFDADTDFGNLDSTAVLYHHGLDKTMKTRPIGQGKLTIDDVGVWIEAQLDMANEYVKYLYERGILKGRFGWSSGTASHLVERETIAGKVHIKRWPLGLDASITPTPAEPRNVAVSLKTISEADIIPEAAETAGEVKAEAVEPVTETKSNTLPTEGKTMPEITREEIAAFVAEQIKAAQPDGVRGILATKATPAVNMNPKPDTTKSAMVRWMRTGDEGAGREVNEATKTANPWVEGTAADGGVTVPEDYWPSIVEKRDPGSIIRNAPGALIIPTSRASIQIPTQADRQAIFTLTTEGDDSNDSETTPFTDLSITIYNHRRTVQLSTYLISDSASPIEMFMASLLGRAAALTENNYVVAGTGSSQPQGILYGGTAGLTFDSATAIGAGEIPELYHKLPSQYGEGAVWVLRNASMGYLRGLTSSSVFTFAPTPTAGPDLYGKPYFLSDYAGQIAASGKSLCIANFAYFAFAENQGMRIFRDPYTHSKAGYVDFHATIRFGCAVAQAEAFQYGTHPTA